VFDFIQVNVKTMDNKDLYTRWKEEGYKEGVKAGFKLAMNIIKDSATEHEDMFDSIYDLFKWGC